MKDVLYFVNDVLRDLDFVKETQKHDWIMETYGDIQIFLGLNVPNLIKNASNIMKDVLNFIEDYQRF